MFLFYLRLSKIWTTQEISFFSVKIIKTFVLNFSDWIVQTIYYSRSMLRFGDILWFFATHLGWIQRADDPRLQVRRDQVGAVHSPAESDQAQPGEAGLDAEANQGPGHCWSAAQENRPGRLLCPVTEPTQVRVISWRGNLKCHILEGKFKNNIKNIRKLHFGNNCNFMNKTIKQILTSSMF